jgi:hypothetical protein
MLLALLIVTLVKQEVEAKTDLKAAEVMKRLLLPVSVVLLQNGWQIVALEEQLH